MPDSDVSSPSSSGGSVSIAAGAGISVTGTTTVTVSVNVNASLTWMALQSFDSPIVTNGESIGVVYVNVTTAVTATTVTISPTWEMVRVNTSAAVVTLNLPQGNAADQEGRKLLIIKNDSAAGSIVVTANTTNTDTIEGNPTATITTKYQKLGIVSDGDNPATWFDLGKGGV